MPSSEPKETELNLALRPYATAGIALVGASVIAATPLAPPPAIHPPALSSQAAVELSAFTNPLDTWASVLAATITNLEVRGQVIINNPAPILRQVIANQMANATALAGIGQQVATNIEGLLDPSNPYGSVGWLQKAVDQVAAGDVGSAIGSIYQALWYLPAASIGFPLLGAFNIVNTTMTHLQKFVATIPNLIVSAGQNFAFGTGGAVQAALSDTAQGLVDAIEVGDVETAASIALNAPAVLAGAVLNGYGPYGQSGLLGEYGPVKYAVKWLETAAEAIGKPKPSITFNLQPAELPTVPDAAAATSVTLAAGPAASAPKTDAAPTADPVAPEADSLAADAPATANGSTATEAVTPAPAKEPSIRLVRESLVAVPGKGSATTNKPAGKLASDVRDGISSTANKIGEGLKKALTKPAKQAKADNSSKSDAGSGSSGDAR
ncbi:hypothetical protein AB0876_22085 [Mycobacterium sp. NPDC049093]